MSARSSRFLIAVVLLVLLSVGVPTPYASRLPEQVPGTFPSGASPASCLGPYDVTVQSAAAVQTCPPNTAFYGIDDPAGIAGPGSKISVSGVCCPLPTHDVLTEEVSFAPEQCPDQWIATGVKRTGADELSLRCTKINTARYRLAPGRPGAYWGHGDAGWKGAERIEWDNIPASIREAQGHERAGWHDVDGCVGYPWGSMLVGRSTKYCAGMTFRQLTFTGQGSDPAPGTPVRMFE